MSYTRPTPTAPGAPSAAPLVPFACYTVICTKVAHGTGKSEPFNPNSKLDLQILSPDKVTNANGSVSRPAGVEGQMYLAYSQKNMQNVVDTLAKLGVTLPEPAESFEQDVANIQSAVAAQLHMLCFDMTIKSKREAMTGPDGQPILDSRGQPIQGREQADFNMFNIVGNPRTAQEVGANPNPL